MSSREDRVCGLILAAGRSRRLGRPKQTLPFGHGTLLEHAIAQAAAVRELDPVVVVLPAGDLFPPPRMTRARSTQVDRAGACSSSLHAGIRALPAEVDAIAVLPVEDGRKFPGEVLGVLDSDTHTETARRRHQVFGIASARNRMFSSRVGRSPADIPMPAVVVTKL